MREDREVDDSQGAVVRRGRPLHEVRSDPGRHHHASGTHAHPDRVGQRRQQIGQPGLPHPVAQVRRVAAVDEEHVGLPNPGDPSLRADGGQCGELEDTERRPAQAGQVLPLGLGGDEAPHRCRTAHRVTPLRRRDAERVALGDRLAEQVDERRVDARVRDAAGREKKPHACLLYVAVMTLSSRAARSGAGIQTGHRGETNRRCDPSSPVRTCMCGHPWRPQASLLIDGYPVDLLAVRTQARVRPSAGHPAARDRLPAVR